MKYAIRPLFWVLAAISLLLVLPKLGQACPTCFASTSKEVLQSYYVSVAGLSLLPFGIVGFISLWLKRQKSQGHGEKPTFF